MTFREIYDGKIVQVTDLKGNSFTGMAYPFSESEGLSEHGFGEEGMRIGKQVFFKSGIVSVKVLPSYEETAREVPMGRYRHFKGNAYEVIAIARHSETEEPMVIYRALYGDGGIWVRPAQMWTETVEHEGKTCRRFEKM